QTALGCFLVLRDERERLDRAATFEGADAPEQSLLGRSQQLIAPLNRRAKRALSGRQLTPAPAEERQPALQPLQDLVRREQPGPGGSELDRRGQAIQAPADGGNRRVRVGPRRE